jgi:phage terminase large subunit-like protein
MVSAWIEEDLVHGEGDSLGRPVRHDPFQRYILNRKYEYDPATGRLLYDQVVVGMPKGNAKTELFAQDSISRLAGPLAPHSPNIPVAAASWEQANRLFNASRMAISEGPLARTFDDHLLEDRITRPDRPGVLYRIAAIAGTNDGGLHTDAYGDELHEWYGERRERVDVVLGNSLKKRTPRAELPDGRVCIGSQHNRISTAGDDPTALSESPTSLLGKLYAHGIAVAKGEVKAPRFLFLWWEADDTWDLETEEGLRGAILQANPAAGSFLALDNLMERYGDPTVARYEFERYHLNRWVSPPNAWIGLDTWAQRRHPSLKQPPAGTEVCVGFDGSKSRDSTALWGETMDRHVFRIAVWERDQRNPDWVVPRDEVDQAVDAAFRRWNVRLMQMDTPRWERERDDWSERYPNRVVSFDTAVFERFAPAVGHFHDGVVDGTLTHDGDPVLTRHIGNARTRETHWGLVIAKEHKDSPRRIDAAIAAVLADDGVTAPVVERKPARFMSF